jgi:hypothetical protein
MKNETLEYQIKELLKEEKLIKIEWDCGNDEAIVSVYINQKQLDYNDPIHTYIELFLLNKIELPNAGEFSMKGIGQIIQMQKYIYLIASSTMLSYFDYDKEKEVELNEKVAEYFGEFRLFD